MAGGWVSTLFSQGLCPLPLSHGRVVFHLKDSGHHVLMKFCEGAVSEEIDVRRGAAEADRTGSRVFVRMVSTEVCLHGLSSQQVAY